MIVAGQVDYEGGEDPYRICFSTWNEHEIVASRFREPPRDRTMNHEIWTCDEERDARSLENTMAIILVSCGFRRFSCFFCGFKFGNAEIDRARRRSPPMKLVDALRVSVFELEKKTWSVGGAFLRKFTLGD